MKSTVLAIAALAFFAASSAPASARRSNSNHATNDAKYNLKTSAGIQKFWANSSGINR